MANRLNLDFALSTTEERTQFVNDYLTRSEFIQKPLTSDELETISNYILWGKDPTTQKNVKQEKLIELESRSKTWDSKTVESLDALIESPLFNESQLKSLDSTSFKTPKTVFSRQQARENAPPYLLEKLEELWREIDKTELTINFYDLAHNKRKTEPRTELLKQFTESEQLKLRERAESLNQFKYLKLRHFLVELRREQFTFKDSYTSSVQRRTADHYSTPSTSFFDADITVMPLGLLGRTDLSRKIFNINLKPSDFSETDLKNLSNFLWSRPQNPTKLYFDFRDVDHLCNAFLMLEDLTESSQKNVDGAESTLDSFLDTLKFYADFAQLTPLQQDLLNFKIQKKTNQDTALYINKTYNKTYNDNYISTIFRQKILNQIAEQAKIHEEIVENLFFEENFKICKDCGRTLLLSPTNFVRKAKSKDGFSVRCKQCEKEKRQRSK